MLEIGKAQDQQAPILRDGLVVATLRGSAWKEVATLRCGGTEWIFRPAKARRAWSAAVATAAVTGGAAAASGS